MGYQYLSDGHKIPSIGFGTYKLLGKEGKEAIVQAIKVGYRLIDTAQMYGNEDLVGQAIVESGIARDDLFVTTKLNNPIRDYDQVIQSIEESLHKLQSNYIDLVLLHWPIPVDYKDNWQEKNNEAWSALEFLVTTGKIKYLGVSNFYPEHLQPLLENALINPVINQIRLSIGDYKQELVAYCKENDMLVEAYSPLGRGKAYQNQIVIDIASKYSVSISQLMLRWSLQHGFIPIPKSSHLERIKENIDVFNFEISSEDMLVLDSIKGYEEEASLHPEIIGF